MSEKTSEKVIEQAVSILERAVRFRFALLFVSFILSANFALHAIYNIKIVNFDWKTGGHEPIQEIRIGAILTFFAIFYFLFSGVIPIVRHFTERLLEICGISKITNFLFSNREVWKYKDMYYWGYVRLSDSEKDALLMQNSFWAARNDSKSAEIKSEADERNLLANASFMCVVILLLDHFYFGEQSLITIINAWLNELSGIAYAIHALFVGVSGFMLISPWWVAFNNDDYLDKWIPHPELARRRYDEIEKREQEERELKRRIDAEIAKSKFRDN
jgi:hypothetical protein